MNQLLHWRNFMIGVLLWISTWGVFDGIVETFNFGRKHHALICLIVLVFITVYVTKSSTINWSDL